MSAAIPMILSDDARSAALWPARLDLRVERRGERSVLAHNAHFGPLQVQKALHPEGPAVCHLAILHPPGGVAAGDRLVLDARVGDAAHALLTMPGATKWYRSAGGRAEQHLRLHVGSGGILEWLPRETILFDASRVAMSLDVNLDRTARFLGWEILCFGRAAAGEQWRRGRLELQTRVRSEGRLIWSESADVDAAGAFMRSPVGLAGCTVSATLLAAGTAVAPQWVAACRAAGDAPASTACGITVLPKLLVARYLGNSSEQAFHWFRALWTVLRPALLGTAARAPRLWAT